MRKETLYKLIEETMTETKCWDGHERVPGKSPGEPGSCRKKGSVRENQDSGLEAKIRKVLKDEGGAAGMDAIVKGADSEEKDIKAAIKNMSDVGRHKDGDYILQDGEDIDVVQEEGGKKDACYHKVKSRYDVWPSAYASGALVKCRKVGAKNWGNKSKKDESIEEKKEASKETSLRDWFGRKGEKGSKGGWIDCNAPDGKGGYKQCAQGDRKEYPACRPTPSACKEKGNWGKKSKKREGLTYEGDDSILEAFRGATLQEGDLVCEGCLFEMLQEASCGCPDLVGEAEYQGRKVKLNKPTRGDVKKFKVYVKDPKTGNIKKVNFGHGGSSAKAKGEKTMKIRKNNPKARKSFRARHNCDNPGPKTKARYWSCKKW